MLRGMRLWVYLLYKYLNGRKSKWLTLLALLHSFDPSGVTRTHPTRYLFSHVVMRSRAFFRMEGRWNGISLYSVWKSSHSCFMMAMSFSKICFSFVNHSLLRRLPWSGRQAKEFVWRCLVWLYVKSNHFLRSKFPLSGRGGGFFVCRFCLKGLLHGR